MPSLAVKEPHLDSMVSTKTVRLIPPAESLVEDLQEDHQIRRKGDYREDHLDHLVMMAEFYHLRF
jgi:hypothetical protein